MKHTHYQKIEVKKGEQSTVIITGELTAEAIEHGYSDSLKNLKQTASIPGFRKGHVPESTIIEKMSEKTILEEAALHAIQHEYEKILTENNVHVISRPKIVFGDISRTKPTPFTITVEVFPEVDLGNYKKVAKKVGAKPAVDAITEKDIEAAIKTILEQYKQHAKITEDITLTDEVASKLGNFKTVAEFKETLVKSLEEDKQRKESEKYRIALSEALIEEAKMEVPEIFIESELNKMRGQFFDDISRMGIKPEDYLRHIKKTEADLRTEWRTDAIKRVKLQIILNKISQAEEIKADEETVKKEVDHIMNEHAGADRFSVRSYVETVLTNGKVYDFLEAEAAKK